MSKFSQKDFDGLLEALKPEDSCLDHLYLKSKVGRKEMTCYACADDNYELVVEDFGYQNDDSWCQLIPTYYQIELIEQKLKIELMRLNRLNERSQNNKRIDREHAKAWEDTITHINANFHTQY